MRAHRPATVADDAACSDGAHAVVAGVAGFIIALIGIELFALLTGAPHVTVMLGGLN